MQPTLFCAFCKQPPKQRGDYSKVNAEIGSDIEDNREQIAELKKEIKDAEEEIIDAEGFELDLEPEEGEEVIFPCDCIVPSLEEDLKCTKYENDSQIQILEEEIKELKRKIR